MKRCPVCKFIYPDTDEVCDFDSTPLVAIDEAELEQSLTPEIVTTVPQPTSSSSKRVMFAAVAGIILGLVTLLGYLGMTRVRRQPAQRQDSVVQLATPTPLEAVTPAPPSPSPSAEVSPSPTDRRSPSPTPTPLRANVSSNPVSTGSQTGVQTRVVIRLTNGVRIEADEAWRTKEGVWYRRNGLVTLLKNNQVRTIEKAVRK